MAVAVPVPGEGNNKQPHVDQLSGWGNESKDPGIPARARVRVGVGVEAAGTTALPTG